MANNFMTKPALAPWCEFCFFFFLIKICRMLGSTLPLLWTQLLSTQKAKVGKQSKFPSGKLESYYAAWSRAWNPSAGGLWLERYPTAHKLDLPLPQLCDWHLINKVLTSGLENQNTVSTLTVRTSLPIVETVLLFKWKSASWTNTVASERWGRTLSTGRRVCLFVS